MTPADIRALKDRSGLSWLEFSNRIGVRDRTIRKWMKPGSKTAPGRQSLEALRRLERSLARKEQS